MGFRTNNHHEISLCKRRFCRYYCPQTYINLPISGTPTSMFGQDADLSQLHVLKDCNNHGLGHELVPIVTMNDQILPEVLDNLPPPMQELQFQLSPVLDQQQQLAPSMVQPCAQTTLTGVYTLAEEPELEAEENTSM